MDTVGETKTDQKSMGNYSGLSLGKVMDKVSHEQFTKDIVLYHSNCKPQLPPT